MLRPVPKRGKSVAKGVPYAQEHDLGPSIDFVRLILLQKPVAKAEENNRHYWV
jgi:hypothetical protein